jgi:hypothetical protein
VCFGSSWVTPSSSACSGLGLPCGAAWAGCVVSLAGQVVGPHGCLAAGHGSLGGLAVSGASVSLLPLGCSCCTGSGSVVSSAAFVVSVVSQPVLDQSVGPCLVWVSCGVCLVLGKVAGLVGLPVGSGLRPECGLLGDRAAVAVAADLAVLAVRLGCIPSTTPLSC